MDRMKTQTLVICTVLSFVLCCSSPNEPPAIGYTAKAAEHWASTRALEIWGNPILVSIEAPEAGGGVNRDGKLAKGGDGKWLFGYYHAGSTDRLIIEVISNKARESFVPSSYLPTEKGIETFYIDSTDALTVAEKNGGKDLVDVQMITCKLLGEAIWPTSNPKKIAWEVVYNLKNNSKVRYYIEAYDGIYLGKG